MGGPLLPDAGDAVLERLLDHLQAGPDSISGIARVLSEGRPRPIHRLTVAGYLEALTAMGLLREVRDPPARAFALANPERHLDLHRRIGRAARESVPPQHTMAVVATALGLAMQRPLFLAELRHAGVEGPLAGVVRVAMPERDRRSLRNRFQRHDHIDIPHGDPLVEAEDPSAWEGSATAILHRCLLEVTATKDLVGGRTMQQAALELEPHGP